MLFNSIDFAVFLPIVFILYWFVFHKNLKLQNALIAVSSFIFYGWWDWRFLTLLAFSALVDFFVGLQLQKENRPRQRQYLLCVSIFLNLGLLGFFKYFNFFLDNFERAFTFFGRPFHSEALHIILPVGISFYTFQSLSYGIDVYKRKMEPTKDIVAFLAFVSFFPQLVAGPIERAAHLLPQFFKPRVFDYTNAVVGMRLILWGFFKKIVIADNCAYYVNDAFANYGQYSGSMLVFGAVLFAFQIYGDFSGYSDIAVGLARLFGFDLLRNFRYPYFAKNIADFWQRWHISLTNWFRNYLYIPIGGNRGSLGFTIRNVFIVFLVSGFWHGAKWTYVMWGLVHALLFLPLLISGKNKVETEPEKATFFPSFIDALRIGFTFCCVTFAWIFFRAESLPQAFDYIASMAKNPDFFKVNMASLFEHPIKPLLFYIAFLMLVEWMARNKLHIVGDLLERSKWRYALYFFVLLCIILNIKNEASDFIYFQF
jgi:alginate O-acetyltransferase complex protein AlgI